MTGLHRSSSLNEAHTFVANDLNQHKSGPFAPKTAIEHLLSGTEVKFAFRDGNDVLEAHDLALHVGMGVLFSRSGCPRNWLESGVKGPKCTPLSPPVQSTRSHASPILERWRFVPVAQVDSQ